MKTILTLHFILFIGVALQAQQSVNPKYDQGLATKLGADAYGMKYYIFVILKTGANQTSNKALIDSCFAGHIKNIKRLADIGKLIVAGPMAKNEKTYRGIFLLNTDNIEEANELLLTDPAIREKLLDVELFKWYGSAALPEYLPAADKIWNTGF